MPKNISFDWQLRLSKRAKYPRITIDSYGLVELVWPQQMPKRHMNAVLGEHQTWVLKQLASLDVQHKDIMPPETIDFKAVGQVFDVKYQQQDGWVQLKPSHHQLSISGKIEDREALRYVLTTWVKRQGKAHLLPWLEDVAQDMGVSYKQVRIRLQKNRWGSCSTQGNINLNAALLFLPDHLVRHVLIHELTHLTHHNHSPAFWAAVERFEPDFNNNRILLKEYGMKVPAWLTSPFTHDLHKPLKG